MTIASRRGLDLSAHRSRLLTRAMVNGADLVLVMDARQADQLVRAFGCASERIVIAGDIDPVSGAGRAIRDPWRRSLAVFESSYARLDRCAAVLARTLPPPRDPRANRGSSGATST